MLLFKFTTGDSMVFCYFTLYYIGDETINRLSNRVSDLDVDYM